MDNVDLRSVRFWHILILSKPKCTAVWYLSAKSNLIAYSKFKLSIISSFLQIRPLFGVLYKEEKPRDFSLPQTGRTKTWCIRTWVNISPKPCKAKLFVNFLHKLYQKYVKQDVLKNRHHFPPFFLNKYKMYPKKWRLKTLVYFCCLFSLKF